MNEVFAWVGAAAGFVTFLGTVAVYLRGSADKGTIESLQRSVATLENEGRIKDEKILRLEGADARKDETIAHLRTEVEVLRGVITQEKQIAKVQDTLDSFRVEGLAVLHVIAQEVTHRDQ